MIGTEYFLDIAGNAGLQYSVNPSEIHIFMDDSLVSGNTLPKLSGRIQFHPSVDDLTISRCCADIGDATSKGGSVIENMCITKSYISLYSQNYFNNLFLANNILHKMPACPWRLPYRQMTNNHELNCRL